MGFWKKFAKIGAKAIGVAAVVAPVLPIPDKVKKIIKTVGETEQKVEDVIRKPSDRPPAA